MITRFRTTLQSLRVVTLTVILSGTCVLCLGIGAVTITPAQIIAIICEHLFHWNLGWEFNRTQEAVIVAIRLPRVLLGLLVGGGLAVSGAVMQGLFRNPLADPGLIGVSSGAAVAAVAFIVLVNSSIFWFTRPLGPFALSIVAFFGAATATYTVYWISIKENHVQIYTMLLAGIAINAMGGAITGILTFIADDAQLRNLTFWSLGSLGGATWKNVVGVAPIIIWSVIFLIKFAKPLNAMLLGEYEATHLGFDIEKIKKLILLHVALAVGAAVAVSGIIGFIGLVIPHLLRLKFGPDHRFLLPGCAILGASVLLLADLIARTVVAPAEMPIGIVTSIIGGPFFIYLLKRKQTYEK